MGENVVPVQHAIMVDALSAKRHLEQRMGHKEGLKDEYKTSPSAGTPAFKLVHALNITKINTQSTVQKLTASAKLKP